MEIKVRTEWADLGRRFVKLVASLLLVLSSGLQLVVQFVQLFATGFIVIFVGIRQIYVEPWEARLPRGLNLKLFTDHERRA